MYLDFTEPGVFQVDMSNYVKGILEEFPEELPRKSPSPHSDNLFNVKDKEEVKELDEDKAMQFHRTTAQLLFLSTRARKDIQTAVSFLTTRVKSPDSDDWEKLKRVLQYLQATQTLKLRIQVEDL